MGDHGERKVRAKWRRERCGWKRGRAIVEEGDSCEMMERGGDWEMVQRDNSFEKVERMQANGEREVVRWR